MAQAEKAESGTGAVSRLLFDHMQDISRSWLEQLRTIRALQAEYGGRLMRAKTPSEAAAICNEWMARRIEVLANEQKSFTTAWLGLLGAAMKPPLDKPAGRMSAS